MYVALLRGINIGNRRIKMAALRGIAEGCGFAEVQTYLQSGNIVFTARKGAAKVGTELHDAILDASGIDTRVVIRTAAQMDAIVKANPFADRGATHKELHVVFLYGKADPKRVAAVDPAVYAPDELAVSGTEAYLHIPGGYGNSKIGNDSLLRKLGLEGTSRNWRTCTALAEMAGPSS